MTIKIDTAGIDYYEAQQIARLLVEINMVVKYAIEIEINDINMEREISEHISKLLPFS